MAQNPTDGMINLTADDLNPAGVNDTPKPAPAGTIDISSDVGQGPTAPTPGPKDIQTTTNPKKIKLPPPIVSPTPTVPMFAPDGTPGDIPSEKVHDAIAAGGSIGVPVLAPDGTHGIVPAGRLHDALKAGGKIDSSGWTPDQLNANPTIGQRLEKTITGPGMVIDPDALKNSRNVELSKMSPVAAAQEIHQAASIPLVRPEQAMTPEEQQANPTLHAGLEFAGGLSSPENLAIMVGSGGLGKLPGPAPQIIGKALSAGFSLQVIAQTAQESPKFLEALARGDENEAKYELTKMVLGLGMAEQGIEHVGTNEATGEKAFNPNLGTAVGTSIDALTHAAGEYTGKALEAVGNIPGAELVKGAAKLATGVVKQPIDAMTEGPEAKITRAAGGSAGVQERDFQENLPRTLKYVLDANKENPIKVPDDMAEAATSQKKKLWDEKLAKPHPGETIDGDEIAQKIKDSVNPATRKHDAAIAAQIDKWADTFKGPYGLDDAMGAISKFNADLRNFYKQSPSDQFRMAQADPKLGMLQDAADSLRDVAFDKLEKLGEKNIPELRKDYGALNQLQRIFEKRAVVYGRQAPIDLKQSLGGIAAFASGHPLAATIPFITKYLNSPEYLLKSGIEKAGKAAEKAQTGKPLVEQPNRPVNEIRPPGVEPKTPVSKPVTETSPAGTAANPSGQQKASGGAAVNPTEATAEPGPDGKLSLEARRPEEKGEPILGNSPKAWLLPNGRFQTWSENVEHPYVDAEISAEEKDQGKDAVRVGRGPSGQPYAHITGKPTLEQLKSLQELHENDKKGLYVVVLDKNDNEVYADIPKRFSEVRRAVNTEYPEKLDLEARTTEAPEQTPEKMTEGVRSDFRPYDSQNPEGYEPRINAPAERRPSGFLPGDEHVHEWGHVTNAALEGWGTEGIQSHLNPDLPTKRTTAAATVIPRGIDWKDPESIMRNSGKILSVVLGGGVANELHSGIPFELNRGIDPDVNLIKNTLRKGLGFTDDEIDAAIRYGRDRAERNLTQPGISDKMLENSKVRESGLSPTMHASPERTEAYAEEVRRIQDANRKPAGEREGVDENRVTRETPGVNRPDDAGTKGPAEGAASTALESRQGLNEKSTGDEQTDRDIRTAGAIPAGSMMNLALFHDPETGSTLALDKREVTPKHVQKHLDESREKFGVKKLALQATQMPETPEKVEKLAKPKTDKGSSEVLRKAEQQGYQVTKATNDAPGPEIGLISPHGRSMIDVQGDHDAFQNAVGMTADEQFDNGWVRKTGPASFQFGKLKSPYTPIVNEVERQILENTTDTPVEISGEDFLLDTTRQDVIEHGLATLIAKARRLEKVGK